MDNPFMFIDTIFNIYNKLKKNLPCPQPCPCPCFFEFAVSCVGVGVRIRTS